MNKEQTLSAIANADISNAGWAGSIISEIENRYAAGYLSAKCAQLGDAISSTDEEYREALLEYCDYNIWL